MSDLSARDLRMRSREMQKDADDLDRVVRALDFLEKNENTTPKVTVVFPGFQDDGAPAARLMEDWAVRDWKARREELIEHFRRQRSEIVGRWK